MHGRDESLPYGWRKVRGQGCRGRRPRRPAEGSTLGGAQRAPPVCYANPLVRLFAPQGQTLLTPRFRSAQPWPLFATPQPLPTMQRIRGGNGEVEGRACPAPTDCRKKVVDERGKGGRQPAPSKLAGGYLLMGGGVKPAKAPQASQARPAPHCVGRLFARARPARKASLVKGRCRAQARRRDSWPSAGVTGNPARPVGIPQAADAASPL